LNEPLGETSLIHLKDIYRIQFERFGFILRIYLLVVFMLSVSACSPQRAAETQKPAPAAKVENPVKEGDLATITLSPEAESRLGIRTAPVTYTGVTRARTYAGEVTLPPDSTILVSAPLAGTLQAVSGEPVAGMALKKGQHVFRLSPFLAPERDLRSLAEKELADAETRHEASKVKLERAEQLLRDKAGSVRQVEQAQEELKIAASALKAAQEKMARINRSPLESDAWLPVVAPDDGMIHKVHVGSGQKVAGSSALFEMVSFNIFWVRVPVYVGDLKSIDRRQIAKIHNLGDAPGSQMLPAKPVVAPPSANPNAATVDLYYLLPNSNAFRPGQKVGVSLSLTGAEESLVIENSAIVRDIHGGEWVYEKTAPQKYTRRRVTVRYITGSQAVLAQGPAQGTQVVVEGAAELFGTEFSTGK
jgi:cobalt-zinc-cadmium efflux system membrane fusion protein